MEFGDILDQEMSSWDYYASEKESGGRPKLSESTVDERLSSRYSGRVERVSEYNGLTQKMKCRCKKCGAVFNQRARSVLDGKAMCRCHPYHLVHGEVSDE